jgi:UDP-glucose 4-epimerase
MMNNLEDSKVLITGGAGFIGSHIADQLIADEKVSEVVLLDNMLRGTHSNIEGAVKTGKARLVEGDIRDRALVSELMADTDYCFHMAALRITRCAEDPREAFDVMFEGAMNVFEACVEKDIKKLVAASSASIYGNADLFPTTEDHHPYNNRTFYGAAKVANELILRSFKSMYGLKYCAMRYFNIFGPRMDTEGKYTEVLIRWYYLIRQGKQPLIFGDGGQSMDFVAVEDIARANILAMKVDAEDEVFNVASQVETSLRDLCFAMLEAMGSNLEPKFSPLPDERKNVEVGRRLADTAKAQKLLDFIPKYDLETGLKRLVDWLDGQKTRIV